MHSKIRIITTWLCFAIIGTFVGCVEETTKMLPGSTGKAGEVVVVMDPVYWTGDLGQHVKDNLAREHTGLPQPEPIFNIVPLPTASFKGLFITHRNIILFSIGKDNPAKIIKTK
ncbi:MAG: DUF4837 family protein, partial [Flavobacteriales bacterium]|nr:DUF4837 family protein [Flavobacteriales bacterium]